MYRINIFHVDIKFGKNKLQNNLRGDLNVIVLLSEIVFETVSHNFKYLIVVLFYWSHFMPFGRKKNKKR